MLARWSSWGAIPQVFDDTKPDWAQERAKVRSLLDESAYAAAQRTTLNAHYTDPAYVAEIWAMLTDLGFTGGTVLEPGCGSGTFIGLAPEGTRMVGVELDATTAAITAGLYPNAEVRRESFADTRFPAGTFDAVVGNVPFSDARLYDPDHNAGGHSMHNHFIIKSLAMTRPGGIVAVLSSSFTLDAKDASARREMNEVADLIGAVRLPTGAHRRAAGTDAVTDLLILRRREPGTPPADLTWEKVTPVEIDGTIKHINNYFDMHPSHVLGELRVGTGMYGAETLQVLPHNDLTTVPTRLHDALTSITAAAIERGLVYTEPSPADRDERHQAVRAQTDLWDDTIVADGHDFHVVRDGQLEPLPVPKDRRVELRQLIGLRDGARALLDAEATEAGNSAPLEVQRTALRRAYEAYVEKYGPINRYRLQRTGKYADVIDPITGEPETDPETGEKVRGEAKMARHQPPTMKIFRHDPGAQLVKALERFDDETQSAAPAGLLQHRVVAPRPAKYSADTPAEAVALSLDQTGGVSLDLVAGMLGATPEEARAQLGTLVYDDPATGSLVHAPDYLSGDVRTKLDQAVEAAASDERYAVNVEALRKVLPDPIGVEDIQPRMGAVWISPVIHQQFLRELLEDPSVRVESSLPGKWEVRGRRNGLLATSEWGTERKSAPEIAHALMDQRTIEVKDEIENIDGRKTKVLNPVETTAAQEKADQMQERFSEWIWENPARAAELAEVYNRRFNSIRLRDYDQAGDYLTLPGMADSLTLRPHQRAAVARMIAEPSVGLFHQVGAGKTFTMVAGATEMKRMGLIAKPCVVVPNHMLEQFSREWLQAYPQAQILAASTEDLTAEKRRLFVAKAATNDWDAVIMTQGAFKTLGVSPEVEADYLDRELAELRASLTEAQGEDTSISVKQIEAAILRREQEYKKKLAMPRDRAISFESTGIDYLIVDEAHSYKNLTTPSKIQGAGIQKGSQAATDLHMKLEYLRARHGDRVATLATATPLANSVTEAYVMQRYLRPDLLAAAGVTSFDGWAATFGSQVTDMELGPAGGFRMKTRFAKFQNVPEMLRMWHVFADVKTGEDLNLDVPQIAARPDGKREPETIVLEPSPELEDYIANIADRAEAVAAKQITPDEDNMLLISTDGRKAALDLRLVDQGAAQTGTVKLDVVADRILAHWKQTRNNTYLDESGEPSPVYGGLQLVFSDLGTPNQDRWDAYTELRRQLVAGGMPPDAVRFMHEAKDDAQKARLFASARSGHVAVLIGSTAKMGVGTNVQNRLTAMHHIDCPWRPADLEQRDGRGIRWGNQNPEVAISRYVVERSFDAYSWQTVARKATFIAQVMKGRLDVREIEDIGDTALSAAEAKALASGNPLVLDRANAEAKAQKLTRQRTAHQRSQRALEHTRATAAATRDHASDALAALRAAREKTIETSGDAFSMNIDGRPYSKRADAAEALTAWARQHQYKIRSVLPSAPVEVGAVGGHTIVAHGDLRPTLERGMEPVVAFLLDGVPGSDSRTPIAQLVDEPSIGTVRALEHKPAGIEKKVHLLEVDLGEAERTISEAEARIGQPFAHAEELTEARAQLEAIDEQLAELAQEKDRDPAHEQESVQPAATPAATPAPVGQDRANPSPEVDHSTETPGGVNVETVHVTPSTGAAAERRRPPGGDAAGGGGIPR